LVSLRFKFVIIRTLVTWTCGAVCSSYCHNPALVFLYIIRPWVRLNCQHCILRALHVFVYVQQRRRSMQLLDFLYNVCVYVCGWVCVRCVHCAISVVQWTTKMHVEGLDQGRQSSPLSLHLSLYIVSLPYYYSVYK